MVTADQSLYPLKYALLIFVLRQLQERGAVRHWADFLKARLEPRSVWQLPGIWEGAGSFLGYGSGRGALRGEEEREEVTDRIRWFAEECDQMQASLPSPFCPSHNLPLPLLLCQRSVPSACTDPPGLQSLQN